MYLHLARDSRKGPRNMIGWRAKDMTLEECSEFQRAFETVFKITPLNREMALFVHAEPDEPGGTVAMTAYQSMVLELMSPGGWRNCEPPSGSGWRLLVGRSDACERFRLQIEPVRIPETLAD